MAAEEKIYDSPTGWVRQHIQRYVDSDGRRGHRWSGVNTLLLTTRGRKSAKLRRTALIYGQDDGRYIIVASKGGHPRHPAWYLNLVANPQVEIQVGADNIRAQAHTVQGEERQRLWEQMVAAWPDYDKYQARAERQIPVVVLHPQSEPKP